MSEAPSRRSVILGIALVAVSVLFNKWLIEATIVPDGEIESVRLNVVIAVVQAASIMAGLFLVVKKPDIRSPTRAELTLLVGSILVTLLILEVGTRIWLGHFASHEQSVRYAVLSNALPEEAIYAPHPYLDYAMNKNHRRGLRFTNSLGYRNNEFPVQKPQGVYRIAVLGGSTAYADGVDDNEKTFTAQLERLLADEYGYKDVQVINAGVPRYTSWESLINLEFRVLDLDPDLVIYYEAVNDVTARLVDPLAYRGDNTGFIKQWAPTSVKLWEHSALLRVISRALGLAPTPWNIRLSTLVTAPTAYTAENLPDNSLEVLMQNPPQYFQRNLENMIAVSRGQGANVMFSTWAYSPYPGSLTFNPYYEYGINQHNEIIKQLSNSHNVPVFDFVSVMPKDRRYYADDMHVNEEGALIMARLFAEYIHTQGLVTDN